MNFLRYMKESSSSTKYVDLEDVDVGGSYEAGVRYHGPVKEVTKIDPKLIKRRDSFEVSSVSDDVAAGMNFSEPIQVSIFSDGELKCQDGHHRLAAAKQRGMKSIPVSLVAINADGKYINSLLEYQKNVGEVGKLDEGYSYQETENSDKVISYDFKTADNIPYSVVFEYTGKYGWEMMFGIKQEDGSIDTKTLANNPKDVMKVLNTIFVDTLKAFVSSAFSYENSLDIILAPQLMKGEPHTTSPFERKRGKLFVRTINNGIKSDSSFWNNYDVSFNESTFEPKSIIMSVRLKGDK